MFSFSICYLRSKQYWLIASKKDEKVILLYLCETFIKLEKPYSIFRMLKLVTENVSKLMFFQKNPTKAKFSVEHST